MRPSGFSTGEGAFFKQKKAPSFFCLRQKSSGRPPALEEELMERHSQADESLDRREAGRFHKGILST